jgi:hypothetical protein
MKVESPYLVTAFIFGAILFAGRMFWRWGDMESAFLLLFFFLVTIGIRLDDIVKKIGATNERLDRLLNKNCSCPPLVQPSSPSDTVRQSPAEGDGLEKRDDD